MLSDIDRNPYTTDNNKSNRYRRYKIDGKKTECIKSDVNRNKTKHITTYQKSTLPTIIEPNHSGKSAATIPAEAILPVRQEIEVAVTSNPACADQAGHSPFAVEVERG